MTFLAVDCWLDEGSLPEGAAGAIALECLHGAGCIGPLSGLPRRFKSLARAAEWVATEWPSERRLVIWNDQCWIRFGLASYDLEVVKVGTSRECDWGQLVRKLTRAGNVVNARLYDRDYDHWENQRYVHSFERDGRTLDGRTIVRHDGKKLVDLSKNRGRTRFGRGFGAAPGHRMWFSNEFFQRAGVTVEEVTGRAIETGSENGLVCATISKRPFDEANPPPEWLVDGVFRTAEEPEVWG